MKSNKTSSLSDESNLVMRSAMIDVTISRGKALDSSGREHRFVELFNVDIFSFFVSSYFHVQPTDASLSKLYTNDVVVNHLPKPSFDPLHKVRLQSNPRCIPYTT